MIYDCIQGVVKINGSFRKRKEETVVITNPHRAQLTPLRRAT